MVGEHKLRGGALLTVLGAIQLILAGHAQAQDVSELVRLVEPASGRDTISKKPRVRVAFGVPIQPDTLQVLLDGMDITSVLQLSGEGFSYVPQQVLAGGDHVLQVRARSQEGLELMREFRFATRHSSQLTELATQLRMGIEAEGVAARRDTPQPDPTYRVQGDIGYRLHAARGAWETSLDTNLWYLNQKLEVLPPQHEGLDLASYRFEAAAHGARSGITAAIGDLQILGTNRALGTLARRGASLGLDVRNVSLGGFALNSQQVFGFRGGTGIGTDPHDNIYGFTTRVNFLDDRLSLRALHARGGEPGSSFGWFTAQGATQGDVTGYILNAKPFPSIEIEAEYDRSDFDQDVTDALAALDDEAYALRVAGRRNAFNFQLAYEHLGANYAVVASPVPRDQNNIAASASFQGARHSVSATVLAQEDNVDDDPLRPQMANREWALDYTWLANEQWMLGGGYRDSRVSSSDEPQGFSPQELQTRGLTGRVQFLRAPWSIALDLALSDQDDRFLDINDSRVLTRTITPSYQSERISIAPLFSVNTTKYRGTGVELEQRNLSLMVNGNLFEQRFGYGLTLSLYDQEASDDTVDMYSRNAELRLSWRILRGVDRRPRATINVRTAYLEQSDRVFGFEAEDWTVWLTVTFNPQFAF